MRQSLQAGQPVNTVRLQGESLQETLDRLDRTSALGPGRDGVHWYRYRVQLIIHLKQPGAAAFCPFVVPTRALSATGMACLFGGFVHARTACVAQLITMHGMWGNVEGVVVRCNHRGGSIHEIEIRFRRPIDLSLYCPEAVLSNVLLTDEDPLVARMMATQLAELGARVDQAENLAAAREMITRTLYDLVLLDVGPAGTEALAAVQELRQAGCVARIVGALPRDSSEDPTRYLAAGFDECVPKPIERPQLAAFLQMVRAEPLFSSLDVGADVGGLINEFVHAAPQESQAIWQAHVAGNLEQLKKLVCALRTRANAYGFEPLARTAASVLTCLANPTAAPSLPGELRRLAACCLRVRCTSWEISRSIFNRYDAGIT